MKTRIEHFGLTFLVLIAALFWDAGCATRTPDPLAGWTVDFNHQPDQTIKNDYHNYIQQLPTKERKNAGSVQFLTNRIDQHAITIEIGMNGTWWEHVLIYDKKNKRIRVIKYADGKYSQW